jgi:hypothetical protein
MINGKIGHFMAEEHGKWVLTVRPALQDLRGNVSGCAGLLLGGGDPGLDGEPEVRELEADVVRAAGHEDIFRLDVPVHQILVVAVLHRLQQDGEQVARLPFGVDGLFHQPLEQLAAVQVLEHHVEELLLLEEVQRLHYIRMVQRHEHFHFNPQ